MTIYCKDCKYFGDLDNMKVCRRYPPKGFMNEAGEARGFLPPTQDDNYCGEAEAKLKGPVNFERPFEFGGEADKPSRVRHKKPKEPKSGTINGLIKNLNAFRLKMNA